MPTSTAPALIAPSVNGIQDLRISFLLPWTNTPVLVVSETKLLRQSLIRECDDAVLHLFTRLCTQIRCILFTNDGILWEGVFQNRADDSLGCEIANWV